MAVPVRLSDAQCGFGAAGQRLSGDDEADLPLSSGSALCTPLLRPVREESTRELEWEKDQSLLCVSRET